MALALIKDWEHREFQFRQDDYWSVDARQIMKKQVQNPDFESSKTFV